MLRTTSYEYSKYLERNQINLNCEANRSKKPVWRDRCTKKAAAVRFTSKRGETIYYVNPLLDFMSQEVDYFKTYKGIC